MEVEEEESSRNGSSTVRITTVKNRNHRTVLVLTKTGITAPAAVDGLKSYSQVGPYLGWTWDSIQG